MADILRDIIARKKEEIAAAKARVTEGELLRRAETLTPPRDFLKALASGTGPRIIAECKRKSPSRGVMAQFYDPVALAQAYERGGAAAISVLTDVEFFGGALSDLYTVRAHVTLPCMRKDFIIDPYQIAEARAFGADSFLLLAGVLDAEQLEALLTAGRQLGMEALVESHTDDELALARATSARILGINNRDLKTFSVDLARARALRTQALQGQPDRIVVCESGIKGPKDIELMESVGYKVFLIGEALITHPDPQAGIRSLIQTDG